MSSDKEFDWSSFFIVTCCCWILFSAFIWVIDGEISVWLLGIGALAGTFFLLNLMARTFYRLSRKRRRHRSIFH